MERNELSVDASASDAPPMAKPVGGQGTGGGAEDADWMSRTVFRQWTGVLAIVLAVYLIATTGLGPKDVLLQVVACFLLGGLFAAVPRVVGWRHWPVVFFCATVAFGAAVPLSIRNYQDYRVRHGQATVWPTTTSVPRDALVGADAATLSGREATNVDANLVTAFQTVVSAGRAMEELVRQHRETLATGSLLSTGQGVSVMRRAVEGLRDAFDGRVSAFKQGSTEVSTAISGLPWGRRSAATDAFSVGDEPTAGLVAALAAVQARAVAEGTQLTDVAGDAVAAGEPLSSGAVDLAADARRKRARESLAAFVTDCDLANDLYAQAVKSRAIAVGRVRRLLTPAK